ncbi:MAG: DUF1932 domain-containing protein [Dehalococcoidia bacterium]
MPVKTVGIISPGDMGSAIGGVLTDNGLDVIACLEGRGELTHTRAAESRIRDVPTLNDVVEQADLLLSVLVPSESTAIAESVVTAMNETGAKPAYAECNAIAPQTVVSISKLIEGAGAVFVDAGIIGSPPKSGRTSTRIYCSGPDTSVFEELAEHGLDVRRVGPNIGQASGLKMVYAASTKGTTAVWTELFVAANALGLSDALMAEFAIGDGSMAKRMAENVPTMPRRARRWVGEMEEIALTFEGLGLTPNIFQGAADMYRLVSETPLADQTSREPDPELAAMLDVLTQHLSGDNA